MSEPIARFAYVSVASPQLGDRDYIALIQRSWKKNTQLKVNGILSQIEGEFRQVIEGPPRTVSQLVAAILADERHSQIEVKQYSLTNYREFAGWSVTGFGWLAGLRDSEVPVRYDTDNVIYSDLFKSGRLAGPVSEREKNQS